MVNFASGTGWRGQRLQTDITQERFCFPGNEARAIVNQPFDGLLDLALQLDDLRTNTYAQTNVSIQSAGLGLSHSYNRETLIPSSWGQRSHTFTAFHPCFSGFTPFRFHDFKRKRKAEFSVTG